jgi:hypothetical protein
MTDDDDTVAPCKSADAKLVSSALPQWISGDALRFQA